MNDGNLYEAIRPDGLMVPLTCTKQQLEEVWIPAGYTLATTESEPVDTEESYG